MYSASRKHPATTAGKAPVTVKKGNTPPQPTIRVTAVGNHPVTPSGAKDSGGMANLPLRPCPSSQAASKATQLRRTQSANAQQNPGTVPATVPERIQEVRQQLAEITGGLSFTAAVQMMRKLAKLGNELHQEKARVESHSERHTEIFREGGVLLSTMDTIMDGAKKQLYVEYGLDINKSSSLKYRLFAKIPGTRQYEVALRLKYLDNIRRNMATGKK